MQKNLSLHGRFLFALLALALGGERADAQGPTLPEPLPGGSPGQVGDSLLGPSPGSGASQLGNTPGSQEGFLGNRPGASTPRVPFSATQAGGPTTAPGSSLRIAPPQPLQASTVPLYGPLGLPDLANDAGASGLTLDQAIERLIQGNLDLRAKAFEIPQAQADILTASLRANPVLYADSQLIPYGSYSSDRPGGPTQYDVNVTLPLDITRKRQARTVSAERAKRVIEAQYQDAVRLEIDNLYTAYIDVLAARASVLFSRRGVDGLEQNLQTTEELLRGELRTRADVNRIRIQLESARINLAEAETAVMQVRQNLATLLNLPAAEAPETDVSGTLIVRAPAPPDVNTLVALAISCRPDVVAYRLGIGRAQADVALAHANRASDVYLLYQPYTFQDNAPYNSRSAHSWALGVTVPLPLFNRNQGNIQRAHLNVNQTRTELASIERRVASEVQVADREFRLTAGALTRIERDLIPSAQQVLETSERRYREGEDDVLALLNARREYNDALRQYRDVLVRHRRSMLSLNTVVGRRIMP